MPRKRSSVWGTIFVIALLLAILCLTALCQKDPKIVHTAIPWFLLILGWCSVNWLRTILAISAIAMLVAIFNFSNKHKTRNGS